MAWLAVNKDGSEIVCNGELYRVGNEWGDTESQFMNYHDYVDTTCELPKGSIFKLIGRNLTWEDEPVEI